MIRIVLYIPLCLVIISCNLGKSFQMDNNDNIYVKKEPGIRTALDSSVISILNSKLQRSVVDFGADDTGRNNSVAAFRRARDYAILTRNPIYVPNGFYSLEDSIQIPGNISIVGEDRENTIIANNSLVPDRPIFAIKNRGKIAFANEIANIFFTTNTMNIKHTGIEVIDASGFNMHNCRIYAYPYFPGTAFRIRGREQMSISDMLIQAEKPIVIAKNPNSHIDADHFNFRNLFLGALDNPVVTIEDNIFLLNVSFDGYQAWVGGTYGLYWKDTKSQYASTTLRLDNVRWEQENGKEGYMIYIDHNYSLQNLIINNMYGGLNANGFYFRKVMNISIDDSQFIGKETSVGINSIASNGYSLLIKNSNIQGKKYLDQYRLNSSENLRNYVYGFKDDMPKLNFPIMTMTGVDPNMVPPNSLFIDKRENKLKFKDDKGNIFKIVLEK